MIQFSYTYLLVGLFGDKEVLNNFKKTDKGWQLYIHKLDTPYRVEFPDNGESEVTALEKCAYKIIHDLMWGGLNYFHEKYKLIPEQSKADKTKN